MLLPKEVQEYFLPVASATGGILITWLTQQLLKKRGTFSYYVNHNKIGQSTDDPIHGQVRVTWNNEPISNLYLSTVELINESMNDYENVTVRTYTSDTNLLSEQTQILDTSRILEWTEKFKAQMHVNKGELASELQKQTYLRQREYVIPAMNRGQVVRFVFLNSPTGINQPSIWLDIVHKGVRLKFRPPQNQILGVSQPHAALVGVMLGVCVAWILIATTTQIWIATFVALTYGLLALVPGAYAIKLWRKFREFIGG